MQRGFTLIELSIVLVIIGLLVGGVLVGRDLIHSSELRSVVSDFEKYKTAFNTFRSKYNCIPGDCATAASFGLGINGNGDGFICPDVDTYNSCSYQFWSQLSAAGLIAGTYSGTGVNYYPVIGTNIPASAALGPGIGISAATSSVGNGMWSNFGNVIFIGSLLPADGGNFGVPNGSKFYGAALTAFDSQWIDAKMDDGHAKTGRLWVGNDYTNTSPFYACSSGPNIYSAPPYSGDYLISDNRPNCKLFYKLD